MSPYLALAFLGALALALAAFLALVALTYLFRVLNTHLNRQHDAMLQTNKLLTKCTVQLLDIKESFFFMTKP